MNGTWPAGWRVIRFDSVASTQDEAISAARQGGADRTAFLARRQTAGRGREGRAWASPEGNLFLSVLLRPAPDARPGACWAELAGVALHDAIAAHGVAGLTVKRPNDILRDGAKLAGLLVDTALAPDGALDWVVIGAGVNIAHAPEVPGRATARLAQDVTPEGLAAGFAAMLDRWLAAGWDAVHVAWAAVA